MVEAFVGTWKLVDTANFDEYMKALGEWGVGRAEIAVFSAFFLIIIFIFLTGEGGDRRLLHCTGLNGENKNNKIQK